MTNLPAFRIHRNDGTSFVTSMALGTTLRDAEAYYMGKTFTDEDPATGKETRWCCVEVEVVLPDVQRFNRLVWAFDVATCYRYDKVTDIAEIVRLADANRLHQLALDLEQFIVKEGI